MGLVPKFEPNAKELPALYKLLEEILDVLKSAILLLKLSLDEPVIEVRVSLPLDVRINPELKLCKPGSLKKLILFDCRKLKKSLSKLTELSLAKATDNVALPMPLVLAVEILLS